MEMNWFTQINEIDGYCNTHLKDAYRRVAEFFATRQNDKLFRFVEIGVYKGKSICHLGMYSIQHGLRFEIIGIDSWQGNAEAKAESQVNPSNYTATIDLARRNIESCGLSDNISLIKADSADVANTYPDGYFDFVFIDGGHSYKQISRDIDVWLPKVISGGIIGGHDFGRTFKGVTRAVEERFNKDELEFTGSCWIHHK